MQSPRRTWEDWQLSARSLRFICAVATAALLFASRDAARVAAHGPPPAALSIIDEDSNGPTLVRLNGGLARRESTDSYRYLCPAAWGDQVVLPAARIPGGPAVVAGSRGLFLVDRDGRVTAHPDPAAAGSSIDFATIGETLYVLRTAKGVTEVLEVDATRVRVIFSEPGPWTTMAATADAIGLQRLADARIEQLRIAPDGSELDRVSAPEPDDSILVLARATSHELYAVLTTAGGRELGRIEADRWVRLEAASASIAGPVELAGGEPLVAIDTQLARLPEPRGMLEGALPVTCLGRLGDVAYACTREGVSALSESGLAEPLFTLSSLQPPDLQRVDEARREPCQIQWEHFRYDLLTLGVKLTELPSPEEPPRAGEGGAGGKPSKPAAGSSGSERSRDDGGCTVIDARPRSTAASLAAFASLALVMVRRRRSRQRRRAVEQAP